VWNRKHSDTVECRKKEKANGIGKMGLLHCENPDHLYEHFAARQTNENCVGITTNSIKTESYVRGFDTTPG
jgi:hypothetical protein